MEREALKMALEALDGLSEPYDVLKAQDALKEVLALPDQYAKGYADAMNWKVQNHLEHLPTAQPEQEPVVWMYQDKSTHEVRFQKHMRDFVDHGATYETPLYTTPSQRKPLTNKQILADETLRYYFGLNGGAGPVSKQGRKIVNAIEALHNIKETEK